MVLAPFKADFKENAQPYLTSLWRQLQLDEAKVNLVKVIIKPNLVFIIVRSLSGCIKLDVLRALYAIGRGAHYAYILTEKTTL